MGSRISHCHMLILAAGQSARLGRPKQLLDFEGTSLIRRVVETAVGSGIGKVVVVLGANSDEVRTELVMPDLHVIENIDWEEGMASSIRTGVKVITELDPQTDGIMILVCDQPYLEISVLRQLLQIQHETGLPVAASEYKGRAGTPAVFHKSFFPQLMEIRGDTGARKLITANSEQVALVHFEKGFIDIDTKEDYEKLIRNK